ncbi:GNAT family N-acetyltransferase [Luteipulveratus sp. YIM 133132]|uniref:GNAT family N-acetyltransferase n=1 Tax=Luteipulveratus flavus TaxID=3031728 RepID=A0ABT6C2F2_9MICO|nr:MULTISPECIES: GNAT family N-acetyltransferase [unclassified Luteipulveratus]MDE9367114.1 GNAT family N-acetyltransferase [Luteipulveratus sp. YIM 133132]MDF8263104.1 GNAT family N-acetyltransferase [Luteipulveratus sp. YIM 133296]
MTSAPDWTLQTVPYEDPTAQRLVAELNADLAQRYGGGDATPVQPAQFAPPSGTFLVASDETGPIGCAGVRINGADAELKRMFIRPSRRREGHARRLLAAIEEYARGRGFSRVILETGIAQPEAIALYESAGYVPIPSYGYYRDEPDCRCYARWI